MARGRACDREIALRSDEEARMMIDMSEEIIKQCKDHMSTNNMRAKIILGFIYECANCIELMMFVARIYLPNV